MTIKAVYFDMGGVIIRTEYQTPRQHLAERLGMEYEGLIKLVFESESAAQATIGQISEDEHWAAVLRRLRLPESQVPIIRDEFFAGDVLDLDLLDFLRSLRPKYKLGLITNAWSGSRPWLTRHKVEELFDALIISAEVEVAKPDARIFQIALEKLGVTASEAVFLDDFPENVHGARAAGMHAIQFAERDQALKELKLLLADHH